MDKKKLNRANELDSFIDSYSKAIREYCSGFSCDISRLGNALYYIDNIDPALSVDIKIALKKAFDSIKNEFENM